MHLCAPDVGQRRLRVGPHRPRYDLAFAAISYTSLRPDGFWPRPGCPRPPDRIRRLRLFCDAYGVEDRLALLDAVEASLKDELAETVDFGGQGIAPYRTFSSVVRRAYGASSWRGWPRTEKPSSARCSRGRAGRGWDIAGVRPAPVAREDRPGSRRSARMPTPPTVTTTATSCAGPHAELRSGPLVPTQRPTPASDANQRSLWLLRAGLAFVFCYAGTAMVADPTAFMMYVPEVLRGSPLAHTFLLMIAGFELCLVIGLLWPRFTAVSALLAAGMMVSIVLLNLDSFGVLFRNVAIACAALSLSLQTRTHRS